MKFSKTILLLSIFTFFLVTAGWSQTKIKKITVSITVKDSKNLDINDATFIIDSIPTQILSKTNGTYKIKIDPNCKEIKVFSFSRGIVKMPYNGKKKMKFIFQDSFNPVVDEVINRAPEDTMEYKNIYEMIRARVPGVTVTPNNRIYIRGIISLEGNLEPLFVVNGSPVPSIASIAPFFVESISILKGPEAAIYGSRGAAGVILITLK